MLLQHKGGVEADKIGQNLLDIDIIAFFNFLQGPLNGIIFSIGNGEGMSSEDLEGSQNNE